NVIYAENTGLSIIKSTDGGAHFFQATGGISDSNFLFITPFAMDPSSSQRLWVGGRSVWRTVDGAASWTRASAALAGSGSVSALAVAPTDPNQVLVGTSDGRVHGTGIGLSSSSATTWASTALPGCGSCYVSWVA